MPVESALLIKDFYTAINVSEYSQIDSGIRMLAEAIRAFLAPDQWFLCTYGQYDFCRDFEKEYDGKITNQEYGIKVISLLHDKYAQE